MGLPKLWLTYDDSAGKHGPERGRNAAVEKSKSGANSLQTRATSKWGGRQAVWLPFPPRKIRAEIRLAKNRQSADEKLWIAVCSSG
jgi:hypothetical protein